MRSTATFLVGQVPARSGSRVRPRSRRARSQGRWSRSTNCGNGRPARPPDVSDLAPRRYIAAVSSGSSTASGASANPDAGRRCHHPLRGNPRRCRPRGVVRPPTSSSPATQQTFLYIFYRRAAQTSTSSLHAGAYARSINRNARSSCAGRHLHHDHRRIFRRIGWPPAFLCGTAGFWRAAMSWTYWVSGTAALVIFFYLMVALLKPERFK